MSDITLRVENLSSPTSAWGERYKTLRGTLTNAHRSDAIDAMDAMDAINAIDAMTLLGAGLMIPAIALLTQRDVARNYPALQPALHALGNPSEQTLVL